MVDRNQKTDKVVTSKGYIQIQTAGGTDKWRFVKKLEWLLDDSEVDRDRIDDTSPVFTRLGDVQGSFKFNFKDTIDMYDAMDPASDDQTMSYLMEQIAQVNFPSFTFIDLKQAPGSSGNKFARIIFTGRIMKAGGNRDLTIAVEEDTIEGEITNFQSAIRAAS